MAALNHIDGVFNRENASSQLGGRDEPFDDQVTNFVPPIRFLRSSIAFLCGSFMTKSTSAFLLSQAESVQNLRVSTLALRLYPTRPGESLSSCDWISRVRRTKVMIDQRLLSGR